MRLLHISHLVGDCVAFQSAIPQWKPEWASENKYELQKQQTHRVQERMGIKSERVRKTFTGTLSNIKLLFQLPRDKQEHGAKPAVCAGIMLRLTLSEQNSRCFVTAQATM